MSKHPFDYHPLDMTQMERLQEVRNAFKAAYDSLLMYTLLSAERTLSIRKLQEAFLWADMALRLEEHAVGAEAWIEGTPNGTLYKLTWGDNSVDGGSFETPDDPHRVAYDGYRPARPLPTDLGERMPEPSPPPEATPSQGEKPAEPDLSPWWTRMDFPTPE